MSYITVYSDFYRPHKLHKNKPYRPEQKWAEGKMNWDDSGIDRLETKSNENERQRILKDTNKNLWGTSTYQADYCESRNSHEQFRTNHMKSSHVGDPKKKFSRISEPENELMKAMKIVFERHPHVSNRQPSNTHRRIMGFCRPSDNQCGLSIYQDDIAKPGYVCIRDNLIKPIVKENDHLLKQTVVPIFCLPDGERTMF